MHDYFHILSILYMCVVFHACVSCFMRVCRVSCVCVVFHARVVSQGRALCAEGVGAESYCNSGHFGRHLVLSVARDMYGGSVTLALLPLQVCIYLRPPTPTYCAHVPFFHISYYSFIIILVSTSSSCFTLALLMRVVSFV